MRRKHARIDQLDGNNTFGDRSDDDSNEENKKDFVWCEYCESKLSSNEYLNDHLFKRHRIVMLNS